MKLNSAEVQVLKIWSYKGEFALRESKRRNKPASNQPGLIISADNYTGRKHYAFGSLAERGLLEERLAFGYFSITDAGMVECRERWPKDGE